LKAVQSFVRPPDTASLKAWAEHPGCPVSISVDWEKSGSLRIGTTAFRQTRVPLPPEALGEVGAIDLQSFKASPRSMP
ncbi:MAG: hypothetical protein QOF32_1615, partial [Gammaproteobacteria bacterium]|nr:hypothetical protein [Gammaproteobacteria bacterium]